MAQQQSKRDAQEDNDRFLDEMQSDLTIISYAIQKAHTNMKG